MLKYLGTSVTDRNDMSVEIKNRLGLGNKCYYGLLKHLGVSMHKFRDKMSNL
jgi:hypothetical protein